jgi:GNAT superfamily N-acetyltransferase
MLVGDWTGQLANERVAEFHRQAERQRLVRLARACRGGSGGVGRGRRWLAGPRQGSGAGPMAEPSTPPATARPSATPGARRKGPDVVVDVTGPPRGTDAEGNPTGFLASKPRDGHPDLPMRSGAWIDPADPILDRVTARDGTVVQLRPLRRHERQLVARFYAGLSPESRRRRFLQPMPRLSEAMLGRLLEVDGRRHVAVVATVDGECVGIARWVALADEPGTAEVAITVTDRYQGRGIGRLLVQALRPAAVRAGLTTLVYLVEPTNRPALRLLRSLGVELGFRDGLVQGRQRLLGQPLLDAPSGSGSAAQWTSPLGGDPSNRPARRHRPWPHRG